MTSEVWMAAFSALLKPSVFLYLFAGVLLGTIIGALPGLSATMGIALITPITFWLDKVDGFAMMMGLWNAAIFAGGITAILINTPGTPASLTQSWDGYPLYREGKGGLALGINVIFNLGMKVRVQPSYSPTYFDRGLNCNHDILNRWTSANTDTDMPALMVSTAARANEFTHFSEYNTYSMFDTWVKSCSYWRLQSVRLGYKLPKEWLKKVGITSASVSFEGRNLMVVASNYDNYLDPETMGNPFAQPITRSYIFGLNVNF